MSEQQKQAVTKAGSHVAVRRGYAEGVVIERGEDVPPGVPVSDFNDPAWEGWMVEKSKAAEVLTETAETL